MLRKLIQKGQKGFTIIEVMIVLAIAGLILVVVLVAVPQLQRNQRDSARKNVLARISTEFGVYAENNDGRLPFAATSPGDITDFYDRYITDKVDAKNPSTGNQYELDYATDDNDDPVADGDQILVHRGAKCNGESAEGTSTSTSTRSFALRIELEGGTTYYCVDNQ